MIDWHRTVQCFSDILTSEFFGWYPRISMNSNSMPFFVFERKEKKLVSTKIKNDIKLNKDR